MALYGKYTEFGQKNLHHFISLQSIVYSFPSPPPLKKKEVAVLWFEVHHSWARNKLTHLLSNADPVGSLRFRAEESYKFIYLEGKPDLNKYTKGVMSSK